MLDLSSVPAWSLPAVILFIFALGVGVQKIRHGSISPDQLKAALLECRTVQTQNHTLTKTSQDEKILQLDSKISGLTRERLEIWDIVRATEKHTAVIITEITWLKEGLGEMAEIRRQLQEISEIKELLRNFTYAEVHK